MSAVFGCSSGPGLRLVGEAADRVVARLEPAREGEARQPRYYAEGRMVVTAHSGRRVPPPRAREALAFAVEGVLATNADVLVESDIAIIGDLIRAIRAAERGDPLPPAQAARAAA